MKKPVIELGFFARGMILISSSETDYVITNIHDINKNEYEMCRIEDMDGKGMFLQLNFTQYLYGTKSWLEFPKEIMCKNTHEFGDLVKFN